MMSPMMYGGMRGGMYGGGGGIFSIMEQMQLASMSIGMLGQGVQMFGMNATLIQNAVTGLIQLLAQSTHSLNDLMGCLSDQTTAPLAQYKLAPPTTQVNPATGQVYQHHSGELVPKTEEELEEERKNRAKRRRTARWVLGLALAALLFWRWRRGSDQGTGQGAAHMANSLPGGRGPGGSPAGLLGAAAAAGAVGAKADVENQQQNSSIAASQPPPQLPPDRPLMDPATPQPTTPQPPTTTMTTHGGEEEEGR